jgi:hypothetical protein
MTRYTSVAEYLKHNDDFPYKRSQYEDADIKNMFEKLKNYRYNERMIYVDKYQLHNVKVPEWRMKYNGKYAILTSRKQDYLDFNILSDMFQEECRMRCRFGRNQQSPFEYFNRNKQRLAELCLKKNNYIDRNTMRDIIYENTKECTTHRPTNVAFLIQLFGAKSVLDISAGWGDRLIGSISMNCDYLGVDPNECLFKGYDRIIKMFGDNNKEKYRVILGEFEKVDLPNRLFDMVYTSPPYFDIEIYNTSAKQSVNYGNESAWFDKFLLVALLKAWDHIAENGIMAININGLKHHTYVYKMLEAVDGFKNSHYLGLISYADQKLTNPQPIWIWRKQSIDNSEALSSLSDQSEALSSDQSESVLSREQIGGSQTNKQIYFMNKNSYQYICQSL